MTLNDQMNTDTLITTGNKMSVIWMYFMDKDQSAVKTAGRFMNKLPQAFKP